MAGQLIEAPPKQQRLTMSYEEWLAWYDEGRRGEWVDGEVVVDMPPKWLHQQALQFLAQLVGLYVQLFDLGLVIPAPFEMRLARSARQPDILFLAKAHRDRLTAERLVEPADLAIELISDHSVARDRADKFYEYQEAGIPEYWIFDPRPGKERSDFHRLNADGKYEPGVLVEGGRYHSLVLPGFWLRPDCLWQDPLPRPLTLLVEMAPDAVRRALGETPVAAETASRDT